MCQHIGVRLVKRNQQKAEVWPERGRPTSEHRAKWGKIGPRRQGSLSKAVDRGCLMRTEKRPLDQGAWGSQEAWRRAALVESERQQPYWTEEALPRRGPPTSTDT